MSDPPDHTGVHDDVTPQTGATLDTEAVLRQLQDPTTTLGRYLVLSTLGEGGMGTVYRAYDPKLQREVALKQLRRREDDQVRARVLREAQAMARLSHPNVVRVFDVDESVEPPLVAMEYVPGITLRRWLRKVRPWREIVEVFCRVGRGLQAAHKAQLVHRDFKPSNVLITSVEDDDKKRRRRVLVADFGLALELDRSTGVKQYVSVERSGSVLLSPAESTVSTRMSGVQGTPRYMAPEQHEGLEPDARADQYAFCLAAWEALSGKYPFARPASERVAAKLDGPPKWTGARHVPRPLVHCLARGLKPDPDERWPSLEPIVATFERYAQPRRRPVTAVATTGFAVFAGLGAYAWWASTADVCSGAQAELEQTWNDEQRGKLASVFERLDASFADRAWTDTESTLDDFGAGWVQTHVDACEAADAGSIEPTALDLQMLCLRRARGTLESTIGVLKSTDTEGVSLAHEVLGRLPSPAECRDTAALKARRWSVPPDLQNAVGEVLKDLERARSLRAAGQLDEAGELAQQASARADELGYGPLRAQALLTFGELWEDTHGGDKPLEALTSAVELALEHDMREIATKGATALVRQHSGAKPQFALAERMADLSLALARGHFVGTSVHARALDAYSFLRAAQGQYDEALSLSEASYRLQIKLHGPDDLRTAKALNNLGLRYGDVDRLEDALEMYRQALEIKEDKLGDKHPVLMTTLMNLGNIARVQNRYDDAVARYERALAISKDVFGPDHPESASLVDNLGIVDYDRRLYAKALARFEHALGIMEMKGMSDSADAYRYRVHIASTARYMGDQERAIALSLECLSYYRRTLGPQHQRTSAMLNNLGNAFRSAGRLEEAAEVLQESFRARLAAQGPKHPDVMQSRRNLGSLMFAQGHRGEAYRMLSSALIGYQEQDSPPPIEIAEVLRERGEVSLAMDQPNKARSDAEKGLSQLSGHEAPAALRVELYSLAARAALDGGDEATARKSVRRALELLRDDSVDIQPDDRQTLKALAQKLRLTG